MTKTISITEFQKLHNNDKNIQIIDVREDFEYEMGHIPGAISKPLSTFPIQVEKDTTYYVVCASGGRSEMACQVLAQAGYDVVNVEGGMAFWRGEIE